MPNAFWRTGNKNVINEAVAQFAKVLIDIKLGYNIYGIYSHTIGPKERPKLAINTTNPVMMSPLANELSSCEILIKNPIPIKANDITLTAVPACNICLRPNLVNK